jgi:prepilin-type N-terminal cleavage/methylation domain-containing protein
MSCQLPVASCQKENSLRPPRAHLHWQLATNNWQLSRGFTLTEILIVVGLIVLMLAMAVPAIRLLRGDRSIDAAENQISALLGRARSEAIANNRPTGLMFFVEARSQDRISVAEVYVTDSQSTTRDVYVELVPDRDFLLLQPGVGVQVVDDCQMKGPLRNDDGYIGYNVTASYGSTSAPTFTPYGGVILFDEQGRLMSRTFGFRINVQNGTTFTATDMGKLLYGLDYLGAGSNYAGIPPGSVPSSTFVDPGAAGPSAIAVRSQFGIVLYDNETFMNQFGGLGAGYADAQLSGYVYTAAPPTGNGKEIDEEQWLDTNATPLLINRYNGTLMRGE